MTSDSKLTPAEIVARDCRSACIHELAHAVVARQSTGYVRVQISPQIDGPGEKSPRTVNGIAHFDPIPDPLALAAVGWAGYVGEIYECDPNLSSGWVLDFYPPSKGDLSETDLKKIKGVGRKHRAHAMDVAISVIRASWPEILVVANALELDYRTYGCAAAEWNGRWRLTDGRDLPVAA